jgi:hypothetical protein
MKQYYYNPVGGDLIILDTEKQDIQIVERIEKVKVWVKGEVRLGDFDGPNSGETPEDTQDGPKRKYTNHYMKRKPSTCKKCGKEGHRSDNPVFHPAE